MEELDITSRGIPVNLKLAQEVLHPFLFFLCFNPVLVAYPSWAKASTLAEDFLV